jgi:alpha-ketoglutaric semialdehyde dehydrogenase
MLHGDMIIAGTRRTGAAEPLHAINPSNDDVMAPAFGGATTSDVAEACALAAEAFRAYRDTGWKRAPSSSRRSPPTSSASAMS